MQNASLVTTLASYLILTSYQGKQLRFSWNEGFSCKQSSRDQGIAFHNRHVEEQSIVTEIWQDIPLEAVH